MRTPKGRAALSNGTRDFIRKVDGRSERARRYQDLFDDLVAERGGVAAMKVAEVEAVRVYAGLAVILAGFHADLAEGKPVDVEQVGQLGDRMDRQARAMGKPKAAQRLTLEQRLAAQGKVR